MKEEENIIKRAAEAYSKGDDELAESLFLEAYKLGSGCAAYNLSTLYKTGMLDKGQSQNYQYWLNESVRLGFKPNPTKDPSKFKITNTAVPSSITKACEISPPSQAKISKTSLFVVVIVVAMFGLFFNYCFTGLFQNEIALYDKYAKTDIYLYGWVKQVFCMSGVIISILIFYVSLPVFAVNWSFFRKEKGIHVYIMTKLWIPSFAISLVGFITVALFS